MVKAVASKLLMVIFYFSLAGLAFAQKDFSREFKVIRVPQGKVIVIALDANPTTGFSWRLAGISDKNVLEFIKKEFIAAEGKMLGAGGVEKWSFNTLKSGQAVIVLEYVRAWEKDSPAAKREEFSVFVK
jgi:inhibitor of cysteine peptidase